MHNDSASEALLRLAHESLSVQCHAVPLWKIPGFYYDKEGHQAAKRLMEEDAQAIYTTALAYRLTGEALYADKAIELIDGWASINRGFTDHDGPLVSAYLATGFLQAAELLKNYKGWLSESRERFIHWMTTVCLPEWDGIQGRNNWWSWSLYAQLSLYRFMEDEARMAEEVLELKAHIDESLDKSGFLPEETRRGTKSIWYHYFALAPLTAAAKIVLDATGEDLFRWISPSGKGLKKALDTLLYYCNGHAEEWPFDKNQEMPSPLSSETWPLDLFEAMARQYGDDDYDHFAASHRPIIGNRSQTSGYFHSYAWVFPELLFA
ncbi:alginate lyase family protein [Paenibacillus sp. HB172176]|uniref:alginate lyase family protein n=1 Tax=Paenibacillus sp. HB172176 TaxID=2493690 RepID=UPI00143B8968|nr:alginate lyase family protein [Paenibacillus sp. HB172176]